MTTKREQTRITNRKHELMEEWLPPYHTSRDAFDALHVAAEMIARLEEQVRSLKANAKPRTLTATGETNEK